MVCTSPNSPDVRPVDIGPALSELRAACTIVKALNCLLLMGVPYARWLKHYVPSFTSATYLSALNPWNLNCHGTLELTFPTTIIAHSEGARAAVRRAPFPPMTEVTGVQGAYTA